VISNHLPRVAVLIPARNEAESIATCLHRVLDQDIPRDQLEVIIVDGDSDDSTGDIAAEVLEDAGLARWVVHHNPGGSTPSNLNAGLALVRAPMVCRVDARSLIPPTYVSTCASILDSRNEVVVVGGAQVAMPRSKSTRDVGIARALNNRYGMGLSRYRRGAQSGPSDTVYLGAFRTAQLRAVGGWDERLGTNQDFDLNHRIGAGGLVWFDAGLDVEYLPRRSLSELFQQYRRFGRWKVTYWTLSRQRPQPRQMLLLSAPVVAVGLGLVGLRARTRTTVAVALGGAAAIELLGSTNPRSPDPTAHAVAVAALGAIGVGWWSGVVQEMLQQATHAGGRPEGR
jgi:succinoglycan biosynthesis protein ExoA